MNNIDNPILGVDQHGQPVYASEYYGNPNAFSVQEQTVTASAALPAGQDKVLGVDQYGQPVYASEYWANPDAFSVQEQAPVTAAAKIDDPILGTDQFGKPVYASEYWADPSAFGISDVVKSTANGFLNRVTAPKRRIKRVVQTELNRWPIKKKPVPGFQPPKGGGFIGRSPKGLGNVIKRVSPPRRPGLIVD